MGLDMYLTARRFISSYDPNEKRIAHEIAGLFPEVDLPVRGVEVEAMYWRKANAIHAWFVENVQSGVDECQEVRVSREKLGELAAVCETVAADPSKAKELLAPKEGFFFGSTDIDEHYVELLKETAVRLRVLLDPKLANWEFHYHSSW